MPRDPRRTALALLLAMLTAAPFAWAQQPKKKPRPKRPKHPKTTAPVATTPEIEIDQPPPPPVAPPPPPPEPPPPPVAPPPPPADSDDRDEGTIYVGLRYRGNLIPKALVNLFADQAGTFYSNQIGIEADLRTRDFSFIPALSYVTYGTGGDVLFLQKGQDPLTAANWTDVNSSMKAIYATVDVMWSKRLRPNLDFEYGAGAGIGVIFGSLVDNWVYPDGPNGPLKSNLGYPSFAPCPNATDTVGTGANATTVNGCSSFDHNGKQPAQVGVDGSGRGNYQVPSWFGGGNKPVFFPWVGIPQIGLRYKPVKQVETRLTVGLALTGFWFGLSVDYGLVKGEKN